MKLSNSKHLYAQIFDAIKQDIISGKLAHGAKIPTENELVNKFNVSIITVRRAIQDLCNCGLLVKRQGLGTFVEHITLDKKIDKHFQMGGFSEMCRANGYEPGCKIINCQKVLLDESESQMLDLPKDSIGINLNRICYADNTPILYEKCFFKNDLTFFLENKTLKNNSIFATLSQHDIKIKSANKVTIEVSRIEEPLDQYLNSYIGEPVYVINCVCESDKKQKIFISRQYILGSKCKLSVDL